MKGKGRYDHLNLKLGRTTQEANLDPIPRKLGQEEGQVRANYGFDLWNLWEAGYIAPSGMAQSLVLQMSYSSQTPCMVESKSLKLFLNQLSLSSFQSESHFLQGLEAAVSACVGGTVEFQVFVPGKNLVEVQPDGVELGQHAEGMVRHESPNFEQLKWQKSEGAFSAFFQGFRSNCPVTGQPDYATVVIESEGSRRPDATALLSYLSAFQSVKEFHEACCERIFSDLMVTGEPDRLKVGCYFTRRGGLDINPVRFTDPTPVDWGKRYWRQ